MPSETNTSYAPDPDELAALVGSRLCHDLISPLGAIGNGVELLTMTMRQPSAELQLIAESVAAANARVKFFRFAFGRAGDQRVGRSEMTALMAQYSTGNRITIDWQPTENYCRNQVRSVCLAILCLEPAMPRGGPVTVSCSPAEVGHPVWTIRGTTLRTRFESNLWAHLDGENSTLAPSEVQFALFARSVAAQGRKPIWSVTETEVQISF
ncbi:MAG TPA: histidine phosphotransferase family protein [Paenirhodobacter sp.]